MLPIVHTFSLKKKVKYVKKSIGAIAHKAKTLYRLTKLTRGVCILDDEGNYKIQVYYEGKNHILEFTEASWNLKGKHKKFTRFMIENRYVLIIIDKDDAITSNPDPELYAPFAPNWVCKGYIVELDGKLLFDFKDVVTINGYNVIQTKKEKENEE